MKLAKLAMIGVTLISAQISAGQLAVEEARLDKAQQAMSHIVDTTYLTNFTKHWHNVTNIESALLFAEHAGIKLWQQHKTAVQSGSQVDDRPLYWQRLAMGKVLQQHPQFSQAQLNAVVEHFDNASRGKSEIAYTQGTAKRIFITGFDPFLLDENIKQSNPSGLAALMLDGKVIELNGVKAEINAVLVPVRYSDFDQGEIESLLAPLYATNSVDLIATISMGRTDFDLERFPGKRRSVTKPDNANNYSGGDDKSPVIPSLNDNPLDGAEFVEFSLPVHLMIEAKGKYKVIDNNKVTTLKQDMLPLSLAELKDEIAVRGGGGGYLSNEISYRSIRLRNQLNSHIPTGHIHTPRVGEFNHEENQAIINQIKEMLTLSLAAL